MSASNIQVAIKLRPIEPNQTSKWEVAGNSIKLVDGGGPEPFYFDHIFDQDASNQVIFDTIAKQIVASGVKGFNGTIFAYGQTSSGKTYTMMGDDQNPGVMVLAAKKIFREIENSTDWQFLLRVSYIEIYNEKIHDLLNKSNTDLKIHETPNGEVAVNCSENIITCEQDLLVHLREGSKQRRIGETNMNDRSSRSHAIFRIIIESRKIDQTDEDSVQISILNLVDLAGSERADQTGATGSRLKEGSHINKSLLFLSRVIKQLAEAKYVCYRDSKLTRILQASLGGNALTAIICTINPTAVEETLSTLSFANRAKVVKNKPQVNEVVSDSAMMKRLVKKIDALTTELEVEKTKNSQIKVSQLQKLLNDEIHKIINSSTSGSLKASSKNRRRTWCPSSMIPSLPEETSAKTETNIPHISVPFTAHVPTKLQLPKPPFNFTPHITVRDVYYQEKLKEIECSPSIDEEFIPGEDVCFDDVLTPQTSPMKLGFKTPTNSDFKLRASLTPKLTEKQSLLKVEQELKELETFTNLENKLNVEHDAFDTLKFKLENAERIIAGFEKERESYAFMKIEHLEAQTNLENCQKRCQDLESKVKDLEESTARSLDRSNRYEKEVTDLKGKINKLEMENRAAVGLEFEFEQHRNKSKRRETELLEALEEKRKEINKLERSLQTITNEMLNNSKEEIQQISRSLNEADSTTTCVNCKDFERILTGKKQLIEDFEKLNTDNQTLNLNIAKISAEAESAKLKADYLETENTSLKKDIENLSSLHGTLEVLQEQIGSLQSEKCRLESVKIEFEVMSKETANKIAEKINITQEIQNLNTQRDSLAAECNKLQTEIDLTICTREELEKIRAENSSLNCELQEIKTKLETTQENYLKLMDENQNKSDSFEKLNMEVISARNQLQTLQNEYQDIQKKYEQIQAECNKHEGTIGDIQSEYESIQNKYQCLQKEYEKLENDSVQSFADCDRVQTQNENLETEIHDLKIKVEEAQRKLLENESLQLELESLRSEMNRLQGEYQKNLENVKKQEGSDLQAENSKLKEDLSSLQLRFNEIQKEYDDISTQLVDNFADYETLENKMANLQDEFDRYKNTAAAAAANTADEIETMKTKTQKLEEDNQELLKENIELKNTVTSMTRSPSEKCDEPEQEIKSESPTKPLNDGIEFVQLAESVLEIEIALGNGGTKIFKALGFNKFSNGTRLIIGNISDISQGTFNELRGAIEFLISHDVHKLNSDIFDSLEMEKHTASPPTSCDSLEGPCPPQSNEELIEEKAKLFENVRELQETVAVLKSETVELANARRELEDVQLIVDQLNSEKLELRTICEENKCKISELSEIISRAESENMKLIADCEELKKAVEFEGTVENVSRESYEELKRLYEEINKQVIESDNCQSCPELKAQILTLKAASLKEATKSNSILDISDLNKSNKDLNGELMCTNCKEYLSKISKLEAIVSESSIEQLNGSNNPDIVPESIQEINEHRDTNGGLERKNSWGSSDTDDKAVQYEDEISNLREELENEKSKHQEVQSEIIDIRAKFTEQSEESAGKIKNLNIRLTKLQTEYDELVSFERMKSTELEESALGLEMLKKDCSQLQETVAGLKNTVAVLEDERNNILQEKIELEKNKNDLNEEVNKLKEDNKIILDEKNTVLEKSQFVEKEKEKITADFEELQTKIQKLVEDRKINEENDEKLEKLKEDLDQNSKEKQELEEKLKKFGEELTTVSAEKQHLQSELETLKEEHEALKENHLKEREILHEKITFLNIKIEELTNERKELESAYEKAKNRSEFLLQQGKNMEDELSLEISQTRNSNSAMKQEMEELKQKLQITEDNLQAALEQINCEKDQLQVEHDSSKNSLLEKITELESECALLKEELAASKQSLLDEVRLKQALEDKCKSKEDLLAQSSNTKYSLETKCSELEEKCKYIKEQLDETKQTLFMDMKQLEVSKKESLQKDEVISELSNKNSTLITRSTQLEEKIAALQEEVEETKRDFSDNVRLKNEESSKKDDLISELSTKNTSLVSKSTELENQIVLLEKQFEETKLCLASEIHLKEVLEKANTERDDLIVQLTNNNNSLVTKSTELEEKLAILGNQFEESKRHLSAEVNRLNKSLVETSAASTAQSSKIDDLMQKIKTFESELQVAQRTTLERDDLLQKIDHFQEEYDSLALKHANLELTKSSFEAELNSARKVVVENAALIKKSNELQNSLMEIQLKCDSLKASNAELEKANQRLSKELTDAIQQAEECNRLRSEIVTLREEVEKEKNMKNKLDDDLKTRLKDWESKQLSFSNQISQLQANISSLSLEKTSIQKDFEDTIKSNSDKIVQLEQQVQSLQKDQNMNVSKSSISPKKEKGMEHWMTENHQMKIKNMSLMDKLDSCQKSSPNEERKNRRLSTHDERRMQSFWDSNRDVSTMTDPTSAECSCSEMNLKLNELKQKLLIRDSQVNTLSMELKNHPLKTENATLKKLFAEEESKQQQLRKEIKKYKSLIVNRTNESRHCAKCADLSKKICVDSFCQTTDTDESECYRKLLSKYEDLKMICRVRHTKIRELEDALSKGKENANNDNISSLHNQQYRLKYEQLKKELNLLQEKYEEAKLLCNKRYEQLNKLSNQQLGNS
ncbi:kinesin-related protein 4 [Eupeodes corollae]|uniref:kinesin-related protein 4 n=1 Tax=Eupeodes corollae TaxID=290404 RepID=UPI002490FC9F|nr:kinesin-related protein 4 [Eupeodes corollae]